ncbi:hypothetical protein LCER1_G001218 [Lachnellula cervina]|uniref:Uncharacterized protein n=1 Tax=Lachnellula cervina TaxID=1316786 RepID=A0A7D8Z4I3_9HELO|nr:hypothetical protein LCER1_G001218 [Lachnellula cervina]
MSTIHDRILAAVGDNTRLHKTLSETDYGPPALQQNSLYINKLMKDIPEAKIKLLRASWKVNVGLQNHKKYKDSHVRRLAYNIGGKKEKFEAEASKGEREWHDAVQEKENIKEALEQLNRALADATKHDADFSVIASTYNAAQQELDDLYASLFNGPTPEMPGEDEKEQAVHEASETVSAMQAHLDTETQARALLLEAKKALDVATSYIKEALNVAYYRGAISGMLRGNALSNAEESVAQVVMLINRAWEVQPAVKSLGDLHVPGTGTVDVMFNNSYVAMDVRDRIRDCEPLFVLAGQRMMQELRAANERTAAAAAAVTEAQGQLNKRKSELQRIRAEAFEKVARGEPLISELPESGIPCRQDPVQ